MRPLPTMDLHKLMRHSSGTAMAHYLPHVMSAGLVLAILYSVYQLVGVLREDLSAEALSVSDIATPATGQSSSPLTADAITALHLFGQPAAAPQKKTTTTPTAAPETRLKLTLHGVMVTEGEDAGAIIETGGGEQKYFAIGDSVISGAVLKEVYADRVILERNQRLETLRLPEKRLDSGAITGSTETKEQQTSTPAKTPGLLEYRQMLLKRQQALEQKKATTK